jgi:hypothetical protein
MVARLLSNASRNCVGFGFERIFIEQSLLHSQVQLFTTYDVVGRFLFNFTTLSRRYSRWSVFCSGRMRTLLLLPNTNSILLRSNTNWINLLSQLDSYNLHSDSIGNTTWKGAFHSKCRINRGLIQRGSTIDHWRSQCEGQFYGSPLILILMSKG